MRLNNRVYAVLLAGLAFVTFSCDDDLPMDEETGGSGGIAHAGTNSKAGKSGGGDEADGGTPSDAGTSSGGKAGSSTGGRGGSGGKGGSGGTIPVGGAGGEGGEAPNTNCGNGDLDPGERCDDTNTTPGDGCSATCTNEQCDECTVLNYPPMRLLPVGDCTALSVDQQEKCEAVLDCVETEECAAPEKNRKGYNAVLPCFCGALTREACMTAVLDDLQGDCKAEMLDASDPGADSTFQTAEVLDQFNSKGIAIGEATLQINDPGLLPTIGCGVLPPDDAGKGDCEAVLDCLYETKCAVGSVRDGAECYCGDTDNDTCFSLNNPNDAKLTGECKAAIQTAAGGPNIVPLQIAQIFYDSTTPVGAAMQAGVKLDLSCQDECFGN